ncbi:hypothetical protein L1887_48926 [Cichorium endivia]|nr:hypothetical protein L1887_48926 [Cichorium endivia]
MADGVAGQHHIRIQQVEGDRSAPDDAPSARIGRSTEAYCVRVGSVDATCQLDQTTRAESSQVGEDVGGPTAASNVLPVNLEAAAAAKKIRNWIDDPTPPTRKIGRAATS